jgi:hypothetical protein
MKYHIAVFHCYACNPATITMVAAGKTTNAIREGFIVKFLSTKKRASKQASKQAQKSCQPCSFSC